MFQSQDPQVQKAYRDSGVVGRFVAFLKSQTPMLFLEGSKGMARFSTSKVCLGVCVGGSVLFSFKLNFLPPPLSLSLSKILREEILRMGGLAPIIASPHQ